MTDQYPHEYLQLRASVPNYDEPYSTPPQENGYDVTTRYPVKRPLDESKQKSRRDDIRSTQRNSDIWATRRDDNRTHRVDDFGFTWGNDIEESKRKVYDLNSEPSITLGATSRREGVRAMRRNDIGTTRRDDVRVSTANNLEDTRREYLGKSQGNALGMSQSRDYSISPLRDEYTSTRRTDIGETRSTEYDLIASRRYGEYPKDPRATGVSMNPYGVTSTRNYGPEYDNAKSGRRNYSSDSDNPKKWVSMALDPSWMSNWNGMFGKMRPRWVSESGRDYHASFNVPKDTTSNGERLTDKERYEARRLRIRTILIVFVLLVVLLAVAITVPVVLIIQSDNDEKTATQYSMEVTVINKNYNQKMENSRSEDFIQFERELCQEVAQRCKGKYKDDYGGCQVTSLSNGSVVVNFTIVIVSQSNSVPSNADIIGLFTAIKTTVDGAQVIVLGAIQIQTNSITVIAAITVDIPAAYNDACTTEGSKTQCKTHVAVCSPDNLCSCGNTEYHNAAQDTCLNKLAYNTSCPVEDSVSECQTSAANCLGGICLCPTDKYYLAADDQCLDLVDIDGTCTMTDSDIECKTSAAICTDNKCKCPVDMYHETTNESCLLKLAYNTSCLVEDSNTACQTSAASCIGGRCFCPSTMYYLSPDDQCVDLVDLDDTCAMKDSGLECKTLAAMCTDNKCQCPASMYHDTTNDECLLQLAYNTSCLVEDSSTACKTSAASCISGRCFCPSTMYYLSPDDQCLDLVDLDGTCALTDSDLECKTSEAMCTDNKCKCPVTMYHETTNDSCQLKLAYNTSCPVEDSSTECRTSAASCIDGRCFCPLTLYYLSPDDQCLDLVDLDGTCTMTDSDLECKTLAAMCTNNKCTCHVDMYHDTINDECLLKLAYNTSCPVEDSSTECQTSAASCIGGQCFCPSTMYYLSQDDNCLDFVELDGTCTMTDSDLECKTSDAVCRDQTCQCSVTMYHDTTENACLFIDCGTPPDVTNGNIVSNGDTKYEDTATVTCDEGHTLVPDTPTLTCQTHGTWGDLPQCEAIACETFIFPDNSIDTSTDSSGQIDGMLYGEAIELECKSGYVLIGGTVTQSCGTDGQWDATTCESSSITCTPFPVIENSIFTDVSESSVTVSCNVGFTISGNKVITCDSTSGLWSDSPSCTIVDCGSFAEVTNGETIGTSTTYKSTITIICDTGYKSTGESTVSCLANGDWSSETTCVIKECGQFTIPEHATVQKDDPGTQYNTTLTIECDEGYTTTDAATVTCTEAEEWSSSPVCILVDCGDSVLVVENGHAIGDDINTTYNETFVFACDTGYTLTGTGSITCQANGKWSTLPQCQIVTCGEVDVLDNGSVVSTTGTSFGDITTLECNTGYILTGKLKLSCLESGDWDTLPTCIVVTCGNLNPPANGIFDSTDDSKEFILTCEDGFEVPFESNTIICNDDGKWSDVGTCDPVVCVTLPQPDHGQLSTTDTGQFYEDEIIITCYAGYNIEGTDHHEVVSRCLANKTWSYSASCEPIKCPEYIEPEFANIDSERGNTEFNSTISVACNEGYESNYPLDVTCLANATWSPSPTCTIKNCPTFTAPEFAVIESGGDNTEFGTSITFSCNEGYEPSDSHDVTCLATTEWSMSPSCTVKQCENYAPPANAFIITGVGNTDFGDNITVSCNKGYETNDVVVVECSLNKTWSDSPLCSKVDCGPLADIANGTITIEDGTLFDATATISCDISHTLSGKSLIKCLSTGSWEAMPTCVKNDCGAILPPNYSEVVAINSTHFNISCDNGYSYNGENIICSPDGNWTEIGTCDPIYCSTLMAPANGMLSVSGTGLVYSELVNISCNQGYLITGIDGIYVPNIELSCFANGSWAEGIMCDPYCEPLEIANGLTNYTAIATIGSTTIVSCDTGYQLEGSAIAMCLSNGMWDEYPTCTIVDCGTYDITNGIVESPETTYGSKVTLACHNGFFLQGSSLITCQATGLWDDSSNCTIVDCGELPNDANGELIYNGTKYNDTASINCNVGTQLVNNPDANLVCSGDGTWVGTLYCVLKDCGDLTVENGNINYLNGTTTYLSMVQISCSSGFRLFNGEVTAKCGEEGFWSTEPGCTNEDQVEFLSAQYSFEAGCTGLIQCSISAFNWRAIAIIKINNNSSTGPHKAIVDVYQVNGVISNNTIDAHVTVGTSSQFSTDSADVDVMLNPVISEDDSQYACMVDVTDSDNVDIADVNSAETQITVTAHPTSLTIEAPTQMYKSLDHTVTCSAEISRGSLRELNVQAKVLTDDQFVTVTEDVTVTTTSMDCYDLVTKIWSFLTDTVQNGTNVRCLIDHNSETELESTDSVTMYKATSYVTMDSPVYNFEIGTTERIVCDILNIIGMSSIVLTRSATESETVIEITNLAAVTPTIDKKIGNIKVDTGMTTYEDNAAHVVVMFSPVKCSDADPDSNESVYTCAALDSNGDVIKSYASTIVITKLPEVVLDFPVQIREDRWTLNIGCDVVLGFPKRDLTFLLKRADESTFSPYVPQVLKPVELRWENRTSGDNDCVEIVRYEFDMDTVAEVWQDTKIQCAVSYGTDEEVLSDIGVFQVVPKSVCDGLPTDTFVAHPYVCTYVVQCRGEANINGEWAYIHQTTCSDGECWISGTRDAPVCDITTTTTTTTPTPSTTPAPGTQYITCTMDFQAVHVGQSAEFECDLRDIAKVTQLVITNTAGNELHNETDAQGVAGDVSVLGGVFIVNINTNSSRLKASFVGISCDLRDTYNIQINGVTDDDIYLHVLADPGDINIMMPSVIITNGRTEITCAADVGVDVDGRTVTTVFVELRLSGEAEFVQVNTGTKTSANYENCQNTETLLFEFYPDQTWADAIIRCVLRNVDSNEIASTSVESGVKLTDANVFFEQTEVSQLIDETVTLKCTATGVDGLSKLEITRGDSRDSIASVMSDSSTSVVDSVTIVTDNTDISDNDGTLEIQFTATCETRGSYYCTSTGTDSPPETLAYVTIKRQPKVESISLSIGWVENRYQFAEHPSECVAEVGYPPGTVYLEATIRGQVQQLASETPNDDAEQNCGNVVTLTYAHPDLINSTWEGATITCRVAGGDDQQDVEVSDVVQVVADTFCNGKDPGKGNELEHPYACSAWLTCVRDDETLDPCTTEDPCYAVPYPRCTLSQCFDWSFGKCYTQSTTTSTTTTTTTTTTPAPGTPVITCTSDFEAVSNGDSVQFECTLRDIAIVSMLKITNQDGIELYNEVDDQGLSGTMTGDVSMVTINDDNTLLTLTFTNVNCEQVGVYTIQMNNVTGDDVTLKLIANEMTPLLTLPSEINANSRTEITCIGEVGLNSEGDTIAKLSFEIQFADNTDFETFSDGVETTLENENCNPIDTLVLTFYPDATWNNALIRCVSTKIGSGDRTMSADNTIIIQTSDVLFENPQLSFVIGETVTMRCLVSNVADLERIEISLGDVRTNIATFMSDGSTTIAEGVTTIKDNTHIMTDSTSSLEIEFIGECGDKGQYYCKAVGNSIPPESLAILEIQRKPTIQSFHLSINWVENRYQFYEHPTVCVVELGYPKGSVYLESDKDGDFQALSAVKMAIEDNDDECSSVATVQYGYAQLVDMSWDGKMIKCRVDNPAVLDSSETVSESKTVNVIPETVCSGTDSNSPVEHPFACYAWLTCVPEADSVDTCSDTNCNAVPLALCDTNQCLDIPSQTCDTVTKTTSTTTTATTTTTTLTGSPSIQCPDLTSPTGENRNIECTLNNIARVDGDILKIMKGDSEILDTQTASSGTAQGTGISYGVTLSLNIYIDGLTIQLRFGPLLCEQRGTYTVQYLSDSEAVPVQGSGDLLITTDAIGPSISTSPAKFYRGQEIIIMCTGNLGSPEGTTDITLKFRSSADGTYQVVTITYITVFNTDVCANDKTLSHSLYVTDNNEGSQYICETTTDDGTTLASNAVTVAIVDPVIYISDSSTSPEIGNAYTISCVVSTTDVTITAITVSKGQTTLSSWSSNSAEITHSQAGIEGSITQAIGESTFSVTFTAIICEDDGEYICDATQVDGATSNLKTRLFLNVTQTPLLKLPSTLVAGVTSFYSDTLDCTATTEQGGSLKLQIYSSDSSSYEDFAIGESITPGPVACSIEKISFRQITFDETYDNVNVRCATFDSSNNMISDDTQAIRLIEPPANCTINADAFYGHPFDCNKYLRCTGGQMYVSTCVDTSHCPAFNTLDNSFAGCSTSNCKNCSSRK